MKILVVGQGGREHALVWKLAQSQDVEKIYCVPGNPGIARIAETIPMPARFTDLADWAETENIALTVVGPEAPLAEGIVDTFSQRGLKAFGPDRRAARLEASKDFAKQLMLKNGIPTAEHRTFTDAEAAMAYIEDRNIPISSRQMDSLPEKVLSPDGLSKRHCKPSRLFWWIGHLATQAIAL